MRLKQLLSQCTVHAHAANRAGRRHGLGRHVAVARQVVHTLRFTEDGTYRRQVSVYLTDE